MTPRSRKSTPLEPRTLRLFGLCGDVVARVAAELKLNPSTVWKWKDRQADPSPLARRAIARAVKRLERMGNAGE
jgi:hypothetical protein